MARGKGGGEDEEEQEQEENSSLWILKTRKGGEDERTRGGSRYPVLQAPFDMLFGLLFCGFRVYGI